jgi:uncharacterized protein YcbK (DUF882 family)
MKSKHCPSRRRLIKTASFALSAASFPVLAGAAVTGPRRLTFYHTHTGERLDITYHEGGTYLPDAMEEINHLMRDFRTGEVYPIDPSLLDFLHAVRQRTHSRSEFQIISGYRSPATNSMLRSQGRGVAKHSMHMDGKAIDVRVSDVTSGALRQAALDLGRGGVGYYPSSNFVHLDTGRVRFW